MPGRQQDRIRRRVTVDVRAGDRHFKGLVTDLSVGGLFVQMDAATLPARGVEVELQLAESRFGPAMTLRGEVVRRELASALLGGVAARGIGVRIAEAPTEYHEAIEAAEAAPRGGAPASAAGGIADAIEAAGNAGLEIEVEIEIETDAASPSATPRGLNDLLGSPPDAARVELPALRADRGLASSLLGAPAQGVSAPGAEGEPASKGQASKLPASNEGATGPLCEADPPAPLVLPPDPLDPRRDDVLCVYDGHGLDDVFELLETLGARPQRARLSGPTRFEAGEVPPRLFVIQASDAIRVELPETLRRSTVSIAVADSRSDVLGGMVARIGYDYLVRRPVHSEILQLLLQRVLFRGSDARRHERHVAGWPVRLRIGWRSEPATLLDLSAGGARLLTRRPVDVLSEVRLQIPRDAMHSARSLAGRIIRKRSGEDGTWSVALRFERELDAAVLASLAARIERSTVGPAEAPRPGLLDRLRGRWAQPDTAAEPASGPETEVQPPATDEPAPERREHRRVELEREVLDLDPESRAPRNVLVGRDLSARGLRVDPHPDLRADVRLDLVLFDAAGAPLEVAGRTARDDGDRGWLLAFEDVDDATAARLDALIDVLPAIERLDGGEGGGIVFARIATDRVGVNELLRGGPPDERGPRD